MFPEHASVGFIGPNVLVNKLMAHHWIAMQTAIPNDLVRTPIEHYKRVNNFEIVLGIPLVTPLSAQPVSSSLLRSSWLIGRVGAIGVVSRVTFKFSVDSALVTP